MQRSALKKKNDVLQTTVTYPANGRIGERVRFSAVLAGQRARDLPVDGFTAFQTEHRGCVEVVNVEAGIRITHVVLLDTDVRSAAQAFAESMEKHLHVTADICPTR